MADIATVFGWPPSVMDPMPMGELADWRKRALARSNVDEQ